MPVIVYGNYLSQPSRAVLWAAKMKNLTVELRDINPLAGDAETPEYLAKFPTGYAPALEVLEEGKEPIRIAESGAILPYLAETHGWEDLYPSGALQRAKIQQWIHWYHTNLRFATKFVWSPFLLKKLAAMGINVSLFSSKLEELSPEKAPRLTNSGRTRC